MGNAYVSRQVKNCLNSATIKAAKPAKVKGLDSADFHVQPRLVEVNYYGTGIKVSKYDPQNGVQAHFGVQDGESTTPEDFFASRTRVVAVIGGAGYGKTEMLKKFANDVICKKIRGLENITVVYFVYFRDLPANREVTAGELLLGDRNLSRRQIRRYICWIRKHSSRVMLVLDGADQYPELNKLGKRSSFQNYEGKASPVKIINSILSGNLFPGFRILFSAREHAIRHFESEVRPDRTVALIGLSLEDIEKLVLCYGGESGQNIWRHLNTKAQCLLSVCSIPMFLNFTVLVFLKTDKAPETLTEVLLQTLYNMVTSEHMRSQESIHNIIGKLREMAFNGTNEERVTFRPQDLPRNITMEEVQDLMIPYPGRSGVNQKLGDGLFRFIFSHQSLQEALSSLHLNQMPIPEFENVIEKLHQPQWAIVRRFTCGIVVNKTLQDIVNDVDLQENTKCETRLAEKSNSPVTNIIYGTNIQKSTIIANQYLESGARSKNSYHESTLTAASTDDVSALSGRQTSPVKKCTTDKTSQVARRRSAILKESLTKELERAVGHRDLLELFHSLHECGDGIESILPPSMTEIILGDIIPSPAEAYVIGAIAKKCNQIRHVFLNTINTAQLSRLTNAVKEQKLKVKFKNTTIPQQGKELVNLLRVFLECGDDIHNILPPSLTKIALGDFVPSQRNLSIIDKIAGKCDQIRHVVLNTINAAQLSVLATVIKKRQLKVIFKDTTILQQGKEFVNLLQVFLKCGEDIHDILPPSLTEIALGDFVPSQRELSVIAEIARKCDQIREVALKTTNAAQLSRLAKVINEQQLEVTYLCKTIEMRNHDLLQLFRAFNECGNNIARVIKSSVKIVNLDHAKLNKSNVYDLVFVLKLCSDLQYLGIWCPESTLFQTVAHVITMANLKIRNFTIVIANGFFTMGPPLSELAPTICNLIPHVTDRLTLHVSEHNDDKISLRQIQEKLDSLLKTELKIDILSYPEGRYELSWKQPHRSPRRL